MSGGMLTPVEFSGTNIGMAAIDLNKAACLLKNSNKQVSVICAGELIRKLSMCGGIDRNVKSVRMSVGNELTAYLDTLRLQCKAFPNLKIHTAHIKITEGFIREFFTSTNPARLWTSNWTSDMIDRLEKYTGMVHVQKHMCAKLHTTLLTLGRIVAQGANDILDLRHSVQEILDINARRRAVQPPSRFGQQSITNYFTDSNGLTAPERAALQRELLLKVY